MTNNFSRNLQITKQAAAFRLRQLLDQLAVVVAAFPDLRDAFDPDELPLEFILKRDSQAAAVDAGDRGSQRPQQHLSH
jgi:hypothetical protein